MPGEGDLSKRRRQRAGKIALTLDYSREQLDKAYDQSLWAPQMDAAINEAGLDFDLSKTATLGLSYSGQLASNAQDHGFKADLTVKF